MKYTSDHTTNELMEMGYIEGGIKDLVDTLTNKYNIKTNGSCEGHINNNGNCEYPWIDMDIKDKDIIIGILETYEHKSEILLQLRDSKDYGKGITLNDIRIFPYCKTLDEGRDMFDKLLKEI